MTWEPSQHMTTTEELGRTLDKRKELGDDRLFEILRQMADADQMWSYPPGTTDLVAKARNLVALLDDAEVNHGSLIGGVTLRAIGELRLELAKWSGK